MRKEADLNLMIIEVVEISVSVCLSEYHFLTESKKLNSFWLNIH